VYQIIRQCITETFSKALKNTSQADLWRCLDAPQSSVVIRMDRFRPAVLAVTGALG
jgi:hypothetical protein